MTKRPSIASLARKPTPQSEPLTETEIGPMADKKAAPYKSVLSKVDENTHRQLKRLAVDEGVPVGDLQIEAINLLFRDRRLPEIAVRVTPDERSRYRS